jgi:hypothetical protein
MAVSEKDLGVINPELGLIGMRRHSGLTGKHAMQVEWTKANDTG